jgi:pimeloyl-ACP methyl ester carboxylesterase
MSAPSKDVLAATLVPADAPPPVARLLVLHGIYGRGRNWTTLARELAAARPDWSAWLIDLRLHGDSPSFAPPHTVAAAASDLVAFEQRTGEHAAAVLGHSFGGKVALAHAAAGHDHLSQAWIIDSTPETRDPQGSAWRMLEVVRRLPATFASRTEAATAIAAHGYSQGVAAWMASNLVHEGGRYRWRLDFAAMEALLRDFFSTDLWRVVEDPPADTVLHFVKANDSHVLSEEGCARIEAAGARHGRAFLHRVAGGHWVHVDNPGAVLALLTTYLPRG